VQKNVLVRLLSSLNHRFNDLINDDINKLKHYFHQQQMFLMQLAF